MTPTYQRNQTDCLRASVATLFDLSYEVVPNFYFGNEKIHNQMNRLERFVNTLGFYCKFNDRPKGYHLLVLVHDEIFYNPVAHATIGFNSRLIFDPYPFLHGKSFTTAFDISFHKEKPSNRGKMTRYPFYNKELHYDLKNKGSRLLAS